MSFHSLDKKRGFTLTEMIVSIGIMFVITGMVLIGQNKYTSNISLYNLANDISLYIRQAQIYGVSVKELSTGTGDFTSAYGVEFNLTASGSNNAYVFFADRGATKNGYYDDAWSCPVGGTSECLQKVNLTSGNTISRLCILRKNDNGVCAGNPSVLVDRVDVTFLRPSNMANILYFNNGGQVPGNSNYNGLEITVASSAGGTHSVVVYTTGQISVR
jgi:type II secretory pathway pseudopilin PulG